jgi:hypothetical protein
MFRTGGPIKEGVMHGIREPYAGGGQAALVGNPIFPKDSSGRAHHFAAATIKTVAPKILPRIWQGLKGAKSYSPGKLGPLKRFRDIFFPTGRYRDTAATIKRGGERVPGAVGSYSPITATPGPRKGILEALKDPTRFGAFLRENPGTAFLAASSIPQTGYAGYRALKSTPDLAKGYVDMVLPGESIFKEKITEEKIDPSKVKKFSGAPGGGDKGMRGDGSYDSAKATELAKAAKEKRINSLLETMGYDKAQKNAAYDALIDASKIITDRGSLKGDVTGEIINPIVQATSKRFDKPQQIREAVGLMQTKADIQKEMNKEENALANELKRTQIAAGKKTLSGGTLEEAVLAQTLKQGAPTGATLATIARAKGVDAKVLPIKIPKNTDTVDHTIKVITESWTNPEVPRVEPGYYVVKDRIIIVDEEGNVSPLY